MISKLVLPTKKEDLVEALQRMRSDGESARNVSQVTWFVTMEYLRGHRDFDVNTRDGVVRVLKDDQTCLDFRYEEVVRKVTDEVGKLLRMDTMPKVTKRQIALDHIRKASTAQLVMDSMVSRQEADRTKMEFIPLVTTYGSAGLVTWIEPMLPLVGSTVKTRPNTPELQVIPSWELLSIPADPTSLDQVTGHMRSRWVSLEWLRSLGYKKVLDNPENKSKMVIRHRSIGQPPTDSGSSAIRVLGETGSDSGGPSGKRKPSIEPYVNVCETWVEGRHGTLAQYTIHVDDLLLQDARFEDSDDPPLMPLGVGRYSPAGGYYSRGMPELLIPMNMRMEASLDNIFENLETLNIFGTTWLPSTAGVSPSIWEGSDVPRMQTYEVDYAAPNAGPMVVHPAAPGAFPAEIVKLGTGLCDRLVPPGVIDTKGRVDSARGLGMLQEMSDVPMTFVAMSIAGAYATAYAAMLDKARRLWPTRQIAITSFLDDSLAGAVIDPKTWTLDPDHNAIPQAHEVEIGITSPFPVSLEQKRRDLYDQKNGGVIDERWYRILSRKLGLDLPVAHEAEWENYRHAMLNNILLFGDGQTPGQGSESMGRGVRGPSDIYDIHLAVISAFMARVEFMFASPEVKDAFYERWEAIQADMGKLQPLNNPEDMVGGTRQNPVNLPPQFAGMGG